MISSGSFDKHCSPFGVSVFAKGWPDDKFIHACNMLAQMLDNDNDGCADDALVVEKLRYYQAGMAMFKTEGKGDYDSIPPSFSGQGLYADETRLDCSGEDETSSCRDAAIEEIFHIISSVGIGGAHPDKFSECSGSNSKLTKQLTIARGGHFEEVPDSYPKKAVFYYYDETCDIQCQATEFFYWAVTSNLGGQDAMAAQNKEEEWALSTRNSLKRRLKGMYKLIIKGNKMKLLSKNGVLPGSGSKGAQFTYLPSSQTCASGCALDGTGCGPLGSKNRAPDLCDAGGCVDNGNFSWKGKGCSWFEKSPRNRCKKKGAIENCPSACSVCDKNGEKVCETKNLTKKVCESISCCKWNDGQCWSSIGRDVCFSS